MEHATKSPSDQRGGRPAGQHAAATTAATLVDNRPAAVAQRELAAAVGDQQTSLRVALSPRVIAQGRRLDGMFGNAVQRRSAAATLSFHPVPAVPSHPLVQLKLKLDLGINPPPEFTKFAILIDAYNGWLTKAETAYAFNEKERRQALEHLHEIEQLTFLWFQKQQAQDLDRTPYGPTMKGLLNQLQNERVALVEWSQRKWDKTPPVANFSRLDGKQQIQLTEIWQRLVKGHGIELAGSGTFRARVLADFSRLLETETGRTIVGKLVEGSTSVFIEEVKSTEEGGKFAASPKDETLEEILEVKEEPGPQEKKRYATLDFTATPSVEARKLALHNA